MEAMWFWTGSQVSARTISPKEEVFPEYLSQQN